MQFTDQELDEKVDALVRRKFPRLKPTQEDIAEMLFGDAFNQPHISKACRRLEEKKRLSPGGRRGVTNDRIWYKPYSEPMKRRI